jgi:hypothetical protein
VLSNGGSMDETKKTIKITEVANGFIVDVKGTIYFNATKVFNMIELDNLVELLGKVIFDDKAWKLRQ